MNNSSVARMLAVAVIGGAMTTSTACASILVFDIGGTVTHIDAGTLFPGKSVDDAFSGSFTVDTNATVTASSSGWADYAGSTFDVTIEGVSFVVTSFSVWSSSFDDGVQFSIPTISEHGYLSLRSHSDILTTNDVPTSYNIPDFDSIADVSFVDVHDSFNQDRGVITSITLRASAVPEPTSLLVWSLLGTVGIAAAYRRRRAA